MLRKSVSLVFSKGLDPVWVQSLACYCMVQAIMECQRMVENIIEDPRAFLASLFSAAVKAADPDLIIKDHLPETPKGRTVVVGAGKGAAQMARAFERAWRDQRGTAISGTVVTRYGYGCHCDTIEVLEAAHPVPDENGLSASKRLFDLVTDLGEDDLVVALICGGGSSLLPAPPIGFTLDDEKRLNDALLASGLSISQMNIVRKHFSRIKGGRLAAAAYPARVVTLLVSDIPGDHAHWIASGPTVADDMDRENALAILEGYDMPGVTFEMLEYFHSDAASAPLPQDACLARAEHRIIASAKLSLEAAEKECQRAGLKSVILSDAIEGEAREAAKTQAAIAREILRNGRPFAAPVMLLSGGETTVTLSKQGQDIGSGGRNSEFALSFALGIEGEERICALFADTDGIDGSEDNAGAYVDGETTFQMRELAIDPMAMLQANRSHEAFSSIHGLFITGPTGTNVNDFRAILIR